MSPLYGVGVNLAVQDAVATANLLTRRLQRWQEHRIPVPRWALGAVQRRRMLPTIITQIVQWLVQRGGIEQALRHPDKEAPSVFSRVPENRTVTRLMSRLSATGILPEHVRTPAGQRP